MGMPPVQARLNAIEAYYVQLDEQLDAELAKGDKANLHKLHALSSRITACGSRDSIRQDHQHIWDKADRIKNCVEEIMGTYAGGWNIALLAVSAIVSIGGGLCGLSPLTGTRVFSAAVTTTLSAASQPVSQAGTGLSTFGSIFDKINEGQRTGHQHDQSVHRSSSDDRTRASNQTHDLVQRILQQANTALQSEHDAKTKAAA